MGHMEPTCMGYVPTLTEEVEAPPYHKALTERGKWGIYHKGVLLAFAEHEIEAEVLVYHLNQK